ncbi:DUF4402 domain-containing protein [Erythrobacter mangrovi]|uniref:DUF4402 domain-containing protein n=1 Tax=Erythrobacter mangrovi TaxID=2739433 RepID=A0A7D4BA55_9SPHN|nr:DUF4402 domain-containing protein [Erythrobacter mangrovi]QKG70606.1 DUF4402 domain-containing protein [Erythrobacter mangrovi]
MLAPPALARDGTSASATGSASAAIVQPITVRALEDLLFGTLAIGTDASGSITVDPASGSVAFLGALRSVCGAGGCLAHPAVFGVTGEAGRRYRIDAPASAIANPVEGAGPALSVVDIQISVSSLPGNATIGLLDSNGEDRFRLGGTLQVPAGSPAGFYRADVEVVVTYD